MAKIEDVIQTKFVSPQTKALVNVRYTSNWLASIQNKSMSKYGLTMPQFNILRILRGAKKELSVNAIKERMVERSPNSTRLMDKLLEKGLIERIRCQEDRRIVYVKISKDGLQVLSQIDEALPSQSLLPSHLSDDESELLSNLLDKMRDGYGNES